MHEIGLRSGVKILNGIEETNYPHTGQVCEYKNPQTGKTEIVYDEDIIGRYPKEAIEAGGETPDQIADRFEIALETIIAQNPGRIVVLVSHADPISFCIQRLSGTEKVKALHSREFPKHGGLHAFLASGLPSGEIKIWDKVRNLYNPEL